MPARYLGIRDSMIEKGLPEKEAKVQAAKIYNSTRKVGEAELAPDYDEKHPAKKEKGNKKR